MSQDPSPPPFPEQSAEMPRAAKPAWQFSLKALLCSMTGVAVFLGAVSVIPPTISGMLLGGLWFVMTGWLITGIVFAKGDKKAFCIGAAVVIASTWTGMGGQFLEAVQRLAISVNQSLDGPLGLWPGHPVYWFKHLVLLAAAVANGYLCIRARRYFEES